MKLAKLAVAAALSFAAVPALAQSQVVAGATVYGPQGEAVGTIEKVEGGVATLDTGTHKAALPVGTYGEGPNGPIISVTKAQINEMVEQAMGDANAKRDAALVAGAAVNASDGQPLGTVGSVEGDKVIVERSSGPVQLTRSDFSATATGGLMARFTSAQIDEAVAKIKAQASAETPAASAQASTEAEAAAEAGA